MNKKNIRFRLLNLGAIIGITAFYCQSVQAKLNRETSEQKSFVTKSLEIEEKNINKYNNEESEEQIVRSRSRRITYKIPAQARVNNRTRISNNKLTKFQTILAPNHIANTISSHPTFAVYFPQAQGNYVVTIEEKGEKFNKTIWQQNLLLNEPGIKTITYPQDRADLENEKDYRFSVRRVVNLNDYSQDIVVQVWLKKIEIAAEMRSKITKTNDSIERASVLAESGIWFDSIALLVKDKDSSAQSVLVNLLEQVGLEEVEKRVKARSENSLTP